MIWYLLLLLIVLALLFPLLLRGRVHNPACAAFDGWVYAHRGCYGPTGAEPIPENSCPAFRRAVEQGVGVELDVHLLADGGLAVIHDSKLDRMTGQALLVEDLTTEQLTDFHLADTGETIPTFAQVLEILGGKVPVIIELKVHNGNQAPLCRAVCKAMEGYPGPYCMESFDPFAVRWLRKNRPDIVRGQLSENFAKSETQVKLPGLLAFGGSYLLLNPLTRPDFIAYRFGDRANLSNRICLDLWGMRGASWTIHNQDELDAARREDMWPIYEGFVPDAEPAVWEETV